MPAQLEIDCGSDSSMIIGTNHVQIPVDDGYLHGELTIPPSATGIVICVGARSECAGEAIHEHGTATLRTALLTSDEQLEDKATHAFSFAVPLLARRLIEVTRWLAHEQSTAHFGFGYFGEEIAGPAALIAAADLGVVIDAVVCRHARPDFAANALPNVEAATMLICCQSDPAEVAFNRSALQRLKCEKQLQVLPPPCQPAGGEPRDCVGCSLAASWFKTYVKGR